MKRNSIRNLTLSSMFLAIAFVLPFITMQIPQFGAMLSPMHFPVLLCGFFCGWPFGLLVGFIAPILRSVILGMPMMFPTAICMAFELATYGVVAGYLYDKLPKKRSNIYVSLIVAMIMGRIVWGVAMFACMGANFGFSAFLSGAILNAIPGIILQLIIVPSLVMILDKKYN